ncbi:MAG: O-antigen ligase family protein [Clostridia bacterium]|nr:O-antigen ligase family protein [Clostridia bacterium]
MLKYRVLAAVRRLCLFEGLSVLLLFCLPFLGVLPSPTVVLTAGAFLVEILWGIRALTEDGNPRFGLPDAAVLPVALSMLFSGFFGAGGGSGLLHALSSFVLVLFWFPMRSLFRREAWKKRALLALKSAALISAVWGIAEYVSGRAELRWVDFSRFSDIGGRVCGPFENPNIFAVFLVAVTPLFLQGTPEAGSRLLRVGNLLSLGACLLCIVFTWSRGAWLAILAALICFFVFYSGRTRRWFLWGAIPVGIAACFLPHSVTNRFLSIGSLSESSINYRFLTWRGVLAMIRAHPWGIGAGNDAFATVFPTYAVKGTERTAHAHALFLQILIEQGVPGLLIFLFFLIALVISFTRTLRSTRAGRGTVIAAFCGIIGVLTMGLFDYVWYHRGMLFLFFALAATVPLREE